MLGRIKRRHRIHTWIVLAWFTSGDSFRIKKHLESANSENAGESEQRRHNSSSTSASHLHSEIDADAKRAMVGTVAAHEPDGASREALSLASTGGLQKDLTSQSSTFFSAAFPASFTQFAGRVASRQKQVSTSQVGVIVCGTFLLVVFIVASVMRYAGMRIEVKYAGDEAGKVASDSSRSSSEDAAGKADAKKRLSVRFAPGTKEATESQDVDAKEEVTSVTTENAYPSFLVEEDVTPHCGAVRNIQIRLPTFGIKDQPTIRHSMTTGSETPHCMEASLSTGSEYQWTGFQTTNPSKNQASGREDGGSEGSRRASYSMSESASDAIASVASPVQSSEDGSDKGHNSPPLTYAAPPGAGEAKLVGAADSASSHEGPVDLASHPPEVKPDQT